MRTTILACSLFLFGCVTLKDIQMRIDATCTGYGFVRYSNEYKRCFMQIDQEWRNRMFR